MRSLPARYQLAFGAACCERHFSDYLRFSQEQNWGSPELLRRTMNIAWAISENGEPPPADWGQLLRDCINAIPHSEQFSMPVADYAQNVGIMVAHLVEFMGQNDPKKIVMTASAARDLVDAKVQITERLKPTDPNLERKISEHPLMVSELNSQRSSLETLRRLGTEPGEFHRIDILD